MTQKGAWLTGQAVLSALTSRLAREREMIRYHNFPETEYEPASSGWFFDHRATGELIGPFDSRKDATNAADQHYNEPFAMPAWALYQS